MKINALSGIQDSYHANCATECLTPYTFLEAAYNLRRGQVYGVMKGDDCQSGLPLLAYRAKTKPWFEATKHSFRRDM
ncbi:MAG TPA: hypothetical protein DEO56_04230 [Nitrosomonas nitrosa]|nr:hypothetical protein [Nitrosomonas nitrosa]HNP51071.1 hypothetical protein [Nitrosomonas nitrosa]